MAKCKIVHYINQFSAGIGGEEKTGYAPELREGVVGSDMGLKAALGEDYEIVSTIICGDNYFGENLNAVIDTIIEMVKKCEPDVFMTDPVFNVGHYGVACGTICRAVEECLGIPVITGMCIENPGVDVFRKDLIIVDTPNSVAGIPEILPVTPALIKKMVAGEEILGSKEEGYTERGTRVDYFAEKRGSERAFKMLVKKLKGEKHGMDPPMPKFDRVTPVEPVKDIKYAKIAVATPDGIIPTSNPDHIESSDATKWGKYDIIGMDRLSADEFTTIHGGYDRQFVTANPNVIVPLDALGGLERAGEFNEFVSYFRTTTGTRTATTSVAKFGSETRQMSIDRYVNAVILVSTWGTHTRYGATMVRGIEKYGVPVVYMAIAIPIPLIIDANRIIPGIGIPYPLDDLPQGKKDSYKLRLSMVRGVLKAFQIPVDDQTVSEK